MITFTADSEKVCVFRRSITGRRLIYNEYIVESNFDGTAFISHLHVGHALHIDLTYYDDESWRQHEHEMLRNVVLERRRLGWDVRFLTPDGPQDGFRVCTWEEFEQGFVYV